MKWNTKHNYKMQEGHILFDQKNCGSFFLESSYWEIYRQTKEKDKNMNYILPKTERQRKLVNFTLHVSRTMGH